MKSLEKQIFSKDDTKLFKKISNKYYLRFILYAFKNLFNTKQFRRYLAKARSIRKNKKISNFPFKFLSSKKKVAIYTVLYGDYDRIKKIKTRNELCDYFIFTDQPVPSDSGWTLREYSFSKKISNNPVLKNRFLKMHPEILFPEYDYSIYIDATISIELDILRLLSRVGDNHLALFQHHAGVMCSYDEAERIKKIGIAPAVLVDKQMGRYKNEGFPLNFGFYECSIIVRKHNESDCKSIMNTWWNEFLNETKRDQLSFMYSVWKNKQTSKNISSLGLTFWIEPILSGHGHKKLEDINANG